MFSALGLCLVRSASLSNLIKYSFLVISGSPLTVILQILVISLYVTAVYCQFPG